MDNQRLLIWAIFAFLAWITYQTWVQDYGPKPVAPVAEQAGEALTAPGITAADEELPAIADVAQADALPGVAEVAADRQQPAETPLVCVAAPGRQ